MLNNFVCDRSEPPAGQVLYCSSKKKFNKGKLSQHYSILKKEKKEFCCITIYTYSVLEVK